MKRITAIVMCCFILFVTSVQVFAADNTGDNLLNSTQLSIKRFMGRLNNEDSKETARQTLRQIGMQEREIQAVSDEYLDMVYNAKSISVNVAYGKMDSNGMETPLPEDVCLEQAERAKAEQQTMVNAQPNASSKPLSANAENMETDSYFKKVLTVIETSNAPKGTMGIICSFQWLNSPLYRALDAIVLSCSEINFHATTASMTFFATEKTESGLTRKQTKEILRYFDYDQMKSADKFIHYDHLIAFKHNLPNDTYTLDYRDYFTDMGFLLTVSTIIVHETVNTNFTVTASYFHQFLGFESDIAFSGEGASVTIDKEWKYWDPKQIGVNGYYQA